MVPQQVEAENEAIRKKVLESREAIFKQTEQEVSKRWAYEEGVGNLWMRKWYCDLANRRWTFVSHSEGARRKSRRHRGLDTFIQKRRRQSLHMRQVLNLITTPKTKTVKRMETVHIWLKVKTFVRE